MIFQVLLILLFASPAIAYDQHSTHPSLTFEMAQYFNFKNNNTEYELTNQETKWLMRGAEDEDEPARWINHFYDPVHGVGWSGKHFGNLSQAEGYKTGADIAPKPSLPSYQWVTNQEYQSAYGSEYGNQTWQKAIKLYVDGNKQAAFMALGHTLHIVEDATVPDHVRDDSHPGIEGDPGSPFEGYSKKQTDAGELQVAESLQGDLLHLDSIGDTIKNLAGYTNQNFFSEDTINNSEFEKPEFNNLQTKILNGKGYLVDTKNAIYLAKINVGNGFTKTSFTTQDSDFVLPSYRDHLFPKAVLTGASVIKLFFEEVEKYKKNPELMEPVVANQYTPFLAALAQAPKRNVIKVCGYLDSSCTDVANVVYDTKIGAQSFFQTLASTVNGVYDATKIKLGLATPPANTQGNAELTNPNIQPAPEAASKPAGPEPVKITSIITPPKTPFVTPPQPPITPAPPAQEITVPNLALPNQIASTVSSLIHMVQQIVYGGGVAGSPSPLVAEPAAVPVSDELVSSTSTSSIPVEEVATSTESATTSIDSVTTTVESVTSTTSTIPVVIIDTTSPSTPVLNIQNQTNVSSTKILVSMQSADELSPPVYFDLDFSTNTIDWLSLATSTTNADFNFSGTRGQNYYFKARAADAVGNISDWSDASAATFVGWSGEVVINEVAWAGTASNAASDEWFELYNRTGQDIDLTGWKISVSGSPINFTSAIMRNKIISARGYYLLERTSDNTIRDISADAVYTLSGGFSNNGEKLELFNPNGEKTDEVDASGGWFAGDKIKYRSMERVDSSVNGSDKNNWQSNQGARLAGINVKWDPVYGSPRQSNFGFIVLKLSQEDAVRTLTKSNSPYVLQYYTIPAEKTLNIEPGVVIKSFYNNASINIYGELNAVGSEDNKIVFTSGRDADFAGSANKTIVGSWSTTTPLAQDWQGVWFHANSVGSIDNIILRYAGHDFKIGTLPFYQAIRMESASVNISKSIFSDNGLLTLYATNSSSTISNSIFSRGEQAIRFENGSLAVSSSSFDNFYNFHGPFTYVTGPVQIIGKWPRLDNLTFTNNDLNMPFMDNVIISGSQTSTESNSNYLLNILTVPVSSTFNIEPGVNLLLTTNGEIRINGSLNAVGSADNPINFSSYSASAYWKNIKFYGSTSTLDYVNLRRGNGSSGSRGGAILADYSNLTIRNSNIWDSDWFGNAVRANNSVLNISNTVIDGLIKKTYSVGISVLGGALSIDNVKLKNLDSGVIGGPADDLPILEKKNMPAENFINNNYPFFPAPWWNLASSTLP